LKRICDILFSGLGLIVLSPIFLVVALWIIFDSEGDVFYKQTRVGKDSKDFNLFKFRSMRVGADKGGLITVGGRDPRVTRAGYYIRKYKIDELPQLINVFVGDMSIVGPRPEVRKYVDMYSLEQMKVLSVRPGITDYASIEYIDENTILESATDPERTYIEEIMGDKIELNLKYINDYTIGNYFKIIFLTLFKIVRG
jgi:lipopolysaccharide/colanic/teichoic acid biosynthesis glycosyltransferase